jgi:hypothetical protein
MLLICVIAFSPKAKATGQAVCDCAGNFSRRIRRNHCSRSNCNCQRFKKRKEMNSLLAVSISEQIAEIIVFAILLIAILYFFFRKK